MSAKYFAILTNQGAARLANAVSLGTKLNLTQMAVGDANGTLPTPDPAQTTLINQKRIAPLNQLSVDPGNDSQIIAEQIIPENEGGFWIREIGLYDDDGILIAVANCPETYKPQLQEGSGRTQTIRMILIVSGTSSITLKIDPSVVLATRKYVDDKIIAVKAYADDVMKKHVDAANPHKQYPLIANALREMADAGLASEALKNLGLGDVVSMAKYGCPLIGELVDWPHALMPHEIWPDMKMEFIPYMAQTFDGEKYPLLAQLHPALKLPTDMRGKVARGWDNGRGIDASRALLSDQDDAILQMHGTVANVWTSDPNTASGVLSYGGTGAQALMAGTGIAIQFRNLTFSAASQVKTASEVRVKNVAWNTIVRAK